MSWMHASTKSALLQAGLGLSLIAFCAATALIPASDPRTPHAGAYGFAYTGAGMQLGAQIWSALESPPFWLLKARAYERAGEFARADQAWRAAINVSGFDSDIGLDYAQFLERHGRSKDVEPFLITLHNRRPENLDVLGRLAQVELSLRQWDKADTVAAAIRTLEPSKALAGQIAAAALIGRGEFDKAVDAYRRLAQQHPSAGSATALATALVAAHKTAEAAQILEAEIGRSPADAQALVLLGWIEDGDGQPDKARDRFTLAIEREPHSNSGYLALAQLDMRDHRTEDAIAVLRSGRRAVPGDQLVQFELGIALQMAKQYDEAISVYEDMLRTNPGALVAANNLAVLLADYRRDRASLDRAATLAAMLDGPDLSQFTDTRGWVSYRRGDYEAATALLERAAAAAPDRAAVRYHLGMSYLARHENAKAAAELKTAATLKPDPELAAEIDKAITAAGR